MKQQDSEILFSEHAFRKDTLVQIVHRKDIDTVNMVITDNGNSVTIPFNLSLFQKDNKALVLNNINRANVIGRAGLTLKNFLKKTMLKKLLDAQEIDQAEYEMRMGELLNKI